MADQLVLVVGDDPGTRDLIRIVLEEGLSLRTDLAQDGAEAVRQVLELKPALVVLDVMLPELGALNFAVQLKSNPATQTIPVIALTARNIGCQEALRAGCNEFVEKPLDLDALVRMVRYYLPSSSITNVGQARS